MSMIMQWDAISSADAERVRQLDEDGFMDWLEDVEGRPAFDVDKAWHGIHFTLTGDAWSTDGALGAVVLGGEEFGADGGYGPPRWLAPDAVAALSERLAALDPQAFAAKIDFGALAASDVYPDVWDRADEREDLIEYLLDGYATIRNGFAAAAEAGHGFVISLL